MKTCQINLAGWNQEIAVDQIDDTIRQIGRKVGTVVRTTILAQAPRDVDPRPALAER